MSRNDGSSSTQNPVNSQQRDGKDLPLSVMTSSDQREPEEPEATSLVYSFARYSTQQARSRWFGTVA